jgi:hypothetical protein
VWPGYGTNFSDVWLMLFRLNKISQSIDGGDVTAKFFAVHKSGSKLILQPHFTTSKQNYRILFIVFSLQSLGFSL